MITSFRVAKVPTGQAPYWVRKQWVGLIFPLESDPAWGPAIGARGGRPDAANQGGYSVTAATAMEVLRQSGPEGERAAN